MIHSRREKRTEIACREARYRRASESRSPDKFSPLICNRYTHSDIYLLVLDSLILNMVGSGGGWVEDRGIGTTAPSLAKIQPGLNQKEGKIHCKISFDKRNSKFCYLPIQSECGITAKFGGVGAICVLLNFSFDNSNSFYEQFSFILIECKRK